MNRYLLLSAAAVLAGTTQANATSFTFASSGGASYCDSGAVTTGLSGGVAWAWTHINPNCAGGTSQGAGLVAKNKAVARQGFALLSDNYEGEKGVYNEATSYQFPKKLKNGAKWRLWIEMSGSTMFEQTCGILKNVTPGRNAPAGNGNTSTLSAVQALIATGARRN